MNPKLTETWEVYKWVPGADSWVLIGKFDSARRARRFFSEVVGVGKRLTHMLTYS